MKSVSRISPIEATRYLENAETHKKGKRNGDVYKRQITPDSGYDQNVLYRLSDEELENFYSTYEENIQKMVQSYGRCV